MTGCIACGGPVEHSRKKRLCSSTECKRRRDAARRLIAKICVICAQPFATTNRRTRACSASCGAILGKRIEAATRAAKAELLAKVTKVAEPMAAGCIVCGGPVWHRRKKRLCASPECKRRRDAAYTARYRRERRYPPAARRLIAKVCTICDRPFATPYRRTRACSARCGAALGKQVEAATRARNAELRGLPLFAVAAEPGHLLRELRRRMALSGLSGKALSIAAGLGVSTVTNILGERRHPRLATLEALARALGCTVVDLTGTAGIIL